MEKSLYNKSNSLKVKIQDENLKRLKAEAISFQIDETMEDGTEIINFCTDKMAVCGSCGKA